MIRYTWIFLVVLVVGCSSNSGEYKAKVQNPDFTHRTLKKVTDLIVHDIFSPPVASRIYAYVSIAGYEALIPQDKKYISLAGQLTGLEAAPQPEAGKEYCFPLASVQAMMKVGKALVFSEDKMDEFYGKVMQEFKDAGVPDDVFERSVSYGVAVADHIMAWSSKDNYKQSRTFPKYSIQSDPENTRAFPTFIMA